MRECHAYRVLIFSFCFALSAVAAVSVQYRVLVKQTYDAYYRLTDPRGQIQSYIFDVVRSQVPRLELDDAFASKADIATAVSSQLKANMLSYGYEIKETLVTDIEPDRKVKAGMNEINASRITAFK